MVRAFSEEGWSPLGSQVFLEASSRAPHQPYNLVAHRVESGAPRVEDANPIASDKCYWVLLPGSDFGIGSSLPSEVPKNFAFTEAGKTENDCKVQCESSPTCKAYVYRTMPDGYDTTTCKKCGVCYFLSQVNPAITKSTALRTSDSDLLYQSAQGLLQLSDEALFEVHASIAQKRSARLRQLLEEANLLDLTGPFVCDATVWCGTFGFQCRIL